MRAFNMTDRNKVNDSNPGRKDSQTDISIVASDVSFAQNMISSDVSFRQNRQSVMTNKGRELMTRHQDNLSNLNITKKSSVQWTDEKKKNSGSRIASNNQNSFETQSPKPLIKKRAADNYANYTPLDLKYRGAMTKGQLESERKSFTANLRKMERIDEDFMQFMTNEFDKITELQKLDFDMGQKICKEHFKNEVKFILKGRS